MLTEENKKEIRQALDSNRRALDILGGIDPVRPEDILEYDRQLRNAEKLQGILASFAALMGG